MPVDLQDTSEEGLWALKSYTGLDSAKDITDIAVYEPMTGAKAFSLVLVRVADGADPKEVAQKMKDNIAPRKWICAMADQVMANCAALTRECSVEEIQDMVESYLMSAGSYWVARAYVRYRYDREKMRQKNTIDR